MNQVVRIMEVHIEDEKIVINFYFGLLKDDQNLKNDIDFITKHNELLAEHPIKASYLINVEI